MRINFCPYGRKIANYYAWFPSLRTENNTNHFPLYTAELFYIIAQAGLIGHSCADDTQLYISAPAMSMSTTVQQFVVCMEAIDAWMGSNRLKMNADKTQLIWLGTKQQFTNFQSPSHLCCLPRWPSCPRFMSLASFSTASWPWKTTFRLCVCPASGSHFNSDLSGRRWCLTLQRHLYMVSSAAVLITVIPHLHYTTNCQTRCTTGFTTGCIV